jgi:phenylacetate-CoA ligase
MRGQVLRHWVPMKRVVSRKNLWRSTPAFLKSMVGTLLKPMPPAWLFGRKYRESRRHALEAQWWPAPRAAQYELERLRGILRLAYERTEFYRRLFDSVGFSPNRLHSLTDLQPVPTIDRQTIVEHSHEMLTRSREARDVDFAATGGTSGVPLHFYIDAHLSGTEYAFLTASWKRVGYETGMPMAVFRGWSVRADCRGLRHEYDPILRHHYYSSFHMSDENMARYLSHITTLGPCFLHVYPSTAAALARFILRRGAPTPRNIRGIIAESESVYSEQRRMVEEVFGCRYFSCYGHSEKLVLAAECEHSSDYHVWPTYGYFELLDEAGKPVTTPGAQGEIVGTGFLNTVMPFIRYRTGDWATYVGNRCEACGREQVIIRDIRGHRTQEVLIAADGSAVPWAALNMHDDTFIHVRQFQFLQETPGQAVLRIVPADGFGEEDKDRIQRNLGHKLVRQLRFTIALVDAISLSARGKTIYVDQRIRNTAADCNCPG